MLEQLLTRLENATLPELFTIADTIEEVKVTADYDFYRKLCRLESTVADLIANRKWKDLIKG